MAIWYNESMVGAVISGLSMDDIKAQIDSMGAGLGDHSVSIAVNAETGGQFPPVVCQRSDGGETVDYTVELMVFDYTIAPFMTPATSEQALRESAAVRHREVCSYRPPWYRPIPANGQHPPV